jgi:hypothetical protein
MTLAPATLPNILEVCAACGDPAAHGAGAPAEGTAGGVGGPRLANGVRRTCDGVRRLVQVKEVT